MTTTVIDTPVNAAELPELIRERINRYLDDAIALEAAGVTGLKDMVGEATQPEDAALFQEHLAQTESQKRRLEVRLAELGGTSNKLKDVMNKIGMAATDLLHVGKDSEDKATRNLIQAYSIENAEIATYESLYAAASAVGDTKTALLAREIQAEEELAAKKIFARVSPNASIAIRVGVSEGRH
ncbi:MAG: DUF892 family protein [Akkermansiaceae bacterium]|nr:DUF892 family protein [Armatimonadota bacterium]